MLGINNMMINLAETPFGGRQGQRLWQRGRLGRPAGLSQRQAGQRKLTGEETSQMDFGFSEEQRMLRGQRAHAHGSPRANRHGGAS